MTNRRCFDAATCALPDGSVVFEKSRFLRYVVRLVEDTGSSQSTVAPMDQTPGDAASAGSRSTICWSTAALTVAMALDALLGLAILGSWRGFGPRSLQALAQRVHQVDDVALGLDLVLGDRSAGPLLIDQIDQRRLVVIFELLRFEVAGLLVDDML